MVEIPESFECSRKFFFSKAAVVVTLLKIIVNIVIILLFIPRLLSSILALFLDGYQIDSDESCYLRTLG